MTYSTSTESNQLSRVLQFVPGFRSGGIETLLMELYRCLDKNQIQFDFIVDTQDDLPEFQEICDAGGRVFQMGRYLDGPVKYQRKLRDILATHGEAYSVLHCHSVIRALPVLWVARQFGVQKRILHSHTDSLEGSKQALFAPLIALFTTPLATDFLACSTAAGNYFFRGKRFEVFSNTIRTERFLFSLNDRERERRDLGINPTAMVVGHTGRFTYQKNHEFLLKVFAELLQKVPDAHLILVGEGPLEEECHLLAEELGIEQRVSFVGLQANVPPFLSAMDVFVLPSHFEGFGISLLEAEANGLPCLASSIIQEEVQVTSSVTTLDLDDSLDAWSKELQSLHERGRFDCDVSARLIKQAGYDTETELANLKKIYSPS